MDRNAQPPFANLPPQLVERLRQLETEMSRELNEPVVLLAYGDVPDSSNTNLSR